jgi:hypothetical protein
MNVRCLISGSLMILPMASSRAQRVFGPSVLEQPAGPRTLAMGGVGVTSRDDEVLFFNPAQLVVANGFSASGERYSSDASGSAMSAVTRFNGGGAALGMRTNNLDARVTTASGSPLGTFTATSLEGSLGFAQVVKGVRVGGALKYAEEDFGSSRVEGGLVDLGVAKQMFGSYTIGAAVQNLGRDMTDGPTTVEMPTTGTIGVSRSAPVGEFDLLGTAAVSWRRGGVVSPAGGLEINYSWLNGYNIAIRAGGRRPLPGEKAITAGAGFTMDRLSIDYAVEAFSCSQLGHRIGLRIR